MPLIPKLAPLVESSDAKTITLAEATGAYDATANAGGYGAPNKAYTAITSSLLLVYPPKATVAVPLTMSPATIPTAQGFANPASPQPYLLTSLVLGLSATGQPLTPLASGSWQVNYLPLFESYSLTLTNGSKTVLMSTPDAALVAATFTHFVVNNVPYAIDTTISGVGSTFYLKDAYTGTTGSCTAKFGYQYILKDANSKDVSNKLVAQIGRLSPHTCRQDVNEMMIALLYKYGIDANGECGNYQGAQDNADAEYVYLNAKSACSC